MAFSSLPQSLTGDFPNSKNLYLALFSAYGAPYAFAAFLKIIQDCLAFLQPQLLRWLLYYVSTYQAAREGQEHGGVDPSGEGDAQPVHARQRGTEPLEPTR